MVNHCSSCHIRHSSNTVSKVMNKDTMYMFDVGTSMKLGTPFYEKGAWWFDAGYAHVKCHSVKHFELKKSTRVTGKQLVDLWMKEGKFLGSLNLE